MKILKLLIFAVMSLMIIYIVKINVIDNYKKINHIKISDTEIDNNKKHIKEKEEEVKKNDSKPNTDVIPNIKENNDNRNDNNANNNKNDKEFSKNNANDIIANNNEKTSKNNSSNIIINNNESISNDDIKNTKPKEEPIEEIIEKGPWDSLGITKYQYENEPIQQGSKVDFKTYQECSNYGNSHEPFINGTGGYNCNEVTSWTKSLGWDYVPFYD